MIGAADPNAGAGVALVILIGVFLVVMAVRFHWSEREHAAIAAAARARRSEQVAAERKVPRPPAPGFHRCDIAVADNGRITIMDTEGNVSALGWTPDRHNPLKRGDVGQQQLRDADTWAKS